METTHTYEALCDMNGTGKNAAARRLSDADLVALRAYAETQPPLPHSTVNMIAALARREQRRRELA